MPTKSNPYLNSIMNKNQNKIVCPECNSAFCLNDSHYAQISQQVRTKEFNDELDKKVKNEVSQCKKILEHELSSKFKEQINEKNNYVTRLKNDMLLKEEQFKNKNKELSDSKDKKILSLESQINLNDANTKIKIEEAVKVKDKEIQSKDGEIIKLKNQIETQVQIITSKLELKNKEAESDLKDKFNQILNDKKNEIQDLKNQVAYFKNYQMSLGSKDLGENLENFVYSEINENLIGVLPNASFGKDNDSSTGSKGDHIFREMDGRREVLSIMFDMKDEFLIKKTDDNKNHKHYRKLHKDRLKSGSEYCFLVSTLEPKNKLFSSGMTLVNDFPKMYVVRPGNVISAIITLRTLALEKLRLTKELENALAKNADGKILADKIRNLQSKSPEYLQKIHSAVAKQLKLIDQNISGANSILRRSKKQRSLCVDEILDSANLWGGFIQDISLSDNDLAEYINSQKLEVA